MNTTNHTSPSGEDAANGAIGGREAAIKAALDVLLKVSPKSNYSDYVWIEIRKAREGLSALLTRAALPAEKVAAEPVALQHVAVAEDGGKLRWMTGRRPRDCELYAMPDGGRAPKLYAAPAAALENGDGPDAWISVEERMPDEDSVVLVSAWEYGKLDGKRFTLVARRSGSLFLNEETGDDLYTPTHWQPLPAAPAALSQKAGEKP